MFEIFVFENLWKWTFINNSILNLAAIKPCTWAQFVCRLLLKSPAEIKGNLCAELVASLSFTTPDHQTSSTSPLFYLLSLVTRLGADCGSGRQIKNSESHCRWDRVGEMQQCRREPKRRRSIDITQSTCWAFLIAILCMNVQLRSRSSKIDKDQQS